MTAKKVPLRIRMERPFEQFGDREKSEFLTDLATLTGCPTDDIDEVSFVEGCVRFQGMLDEVAVHRLVELFKARHELESSVELRDLGAFLNKYQITLITDDLEIRVHVLRKHKHSLKRHVVLVHGWSGDADSFGRLPEFLSESLHCKTSVYKYPSRWWSHSPSIRFVARNLDNWLRNNASIQTLSFVAHSLGGLIVRRFLVMQSELTQLQLDRHTSHVVLVASPHSGVVLSSFAKIIPGLRSPQLSEVMPNSPELFELNGSWKRWVREMTPLGCQVRSVLGTQDRLVAAESAQGEDSDAIPISGADHTNIVRASSPNDEIVLTVTRLLLDGFAHLPADDDRRPGKQRGGDAPEAPPREPPAQL